MKKKNQAYPFLKWAGGKRYLVPIIKANLPQYTDTYWEPFLGGGAVFLAIQDQVGIAHLSDTNADLINVYQILQTRPDLLVTRLKEHAARHDTDSGYYFEIRGQHHLECPLERAARFIYLNRTCFNGLYRVNSKGEFNVPKGKYVNPRICDEYNLYRISDVLQSTTIDRSDFNAVSPLKGDFIYCDPPYDGVYNGFQAGGFTREDRERLRDCALHWHGLGANVMLTDADTEYTRELYGAEPFRILETHAPSSVAGNVANRNKINEILVVAYASQ